MEVAGYYVLLLVCICLGYEVAMWLIRSARWVAAKHRSRKALDALITLQRALDRRDSRKTARSLYRAGGRP